MTTVETVKNDLKGWRPSRCIWVMDREIKSEENRGILQRAGEALDGKYLPSTSDDSLTPEDVALGYKQLMEVERAFRTLKSTLELRLIYHRKDERIKAHVLLSASLP